MISVMKRLIQGCPSYKFVPLHYQVVSRLGSSSPESQDAVCGLISKLCNDHPYHTLPQLLAIVNDSSDVIAKASNERDRNVSAANIMRILKRSASLNSICVSMSVLLEVRFYT